MAASAIYNHPGRFFCTGGTGLGDGAVCLCACGGGEEDWRVWGIDVPPDLVKGDWESGDADPLCSSGTCLPGSNGVGVRGKAGVEEEVAGEGSRTGVLLSAITGGTGGDFDSDCCDRWLRYVGLFIVSMEPLIPLWEGGLTVPSDGLE